MLGWIVAGLVTLTIIGTITITKLRNAMIKNKMKNALITMVDRCENVVRLKDLDSREEYEMRGDKISKDIYEGLEIEIIRQSRKAKQVKIDELDLEIIEIK